MQGYISTMIAFPKEIVVWISIKPSVSEKIVQKIAHKSSYKMLFCEQRFLLAPWRQSV